MQIGLNQIIGRRGAALPVFFLLLFVGLSWTVVGHTEAMAKLDAGNRFLLKAAAGAATEPYTLPPDKLSQALVLGKIRPLLHFGEEFWEIGLLWILLATGGATRLGEWAARGGRSGLLQCVLFSLVLVGLLFIAVDMPVGVIGHSVALHYKISVEGWSAWLQDQAKTLALTEALEVPALLMAFGLMHWRWSRRHYWFWLAAAGVPVLVLSIFLLPELIEPMFNQFEPLAKSHPALVAELERVVARTGTSIPPERMFLMKASDKSNGLNAYVTGLGASKRIVVWDTTADRMPMDEIVFTFAHETGHYVLNHILKGLGLGIVGMFGMFWLTALVAEWMVGRFGVAWHVGAVSSLPGLVVLVLALSAIQVLTEPIESGFSRHIEHEADVYGQEAIHGLVADPQKTAVAAFNKFGEAYLDDPNPNGLIVFWSYGHPSTQQRAIFAAGYDPWGVGGTPRFFSR